MVGKKKWTIPELCLVRVMLKAEYEMHDIVDNFKAFFPRSKHDVKNASIKHVEKEYLRAEEYDKLDEMWSDVPGKKGYLLGLFAMDTDFRTIAQHICNKYPSHRWPERQSKADAVDIALSTFHSCAKFIDGISLVQEYPDLDTELVTMVLKGFETGDSAEQIHKATKDAVPFDHIVFILTRFQPNFWSEWQPMSVGQSQGGSSVL